MPKRNLTKQQNKLRIIGGGWRGRIITFPDRLSVRPTPNRVRETLFNWLAPVIHQAHCLDLFAGSGALGFEALSRGAATVTWVDNDRLVIEHLEKTMAQLAAENASVLCLSLPGVNFPGSKKFDIVFLDPPFFQNYLPICCQWLEEQKLLAGNAYIYVEMERSLVNLSTPTDWTLRKSQSAGQVAYHLFQRES